MDDIFSSILEGFKDLGKETLKSIIGTPKESLKTASDQVSGSEKSAEEIAKEEAEEKKRDSQIKMNLHEQAQMLGVGQEKPKETSEEEIKEAEEKEKKKELPPLEVPQGKRTGELPLKRAQTQIEDKQGYKG